MTENHKEYEILRDEMHLKYNLIQSSISMMYGVTTSVLGFSLSNYNTEYTVCLIPLCIIVPIYIISQNQNKAIAMIGSLTYMFFIKVRILCGKGGIMH